MKQPRMHASHTKGASCGHIFRRCFHASMAVVPFLYQAYHPAAGLLVAIMVLTACLEALRLHFNILLFGQRKYEQNRISAFASGVGAMILLLLLSPLHAYTVAIVFSCAFGDPLLGELRARTSSLCWVWLIGLVCIGSIWFACAYYFHFSYGWICLAPLIVCVEAMEIQWIDDNVLMLLVPLVPLLALSLYNS